MKQYTFKCNDKLIRVKIMSGLSVAEWIAGLGESHVLKLVSITKIEITELKPNQVFVFGSNTQGAHYGGAALMALNKFGAMIGQSKGFQGQSYAIITLENIEKEIDELLNFASLHPEKEFLVTRIGCELAGFEDVEIANLFRGKLIPENILLPQSFINILNEKLQN